MQITLSTAPASESWGKNAILSFNQDQAVIHLKDNEKSNLVLVQKAARKLRGQGIKDVELVGGCMGIRKLLGILSRFLLGEARLFD